MRSTRWIPGLLLALAPLLAAGKAFDMAYRSAMGSYYAALLASARRGRNGSTRHAAQIALGGRHQDL